MRFQRLHALSVMLVRGELVPYVEMLRENVRYPGRALESRGYPAGVRGHLELLKDMFGRALAPACVLGLAAFALGGLSRRTSPT